MSLDHLKQIALTVLSLSATVLVCIAIYYAMTLGPKVRETVSNVNRTSLALADYAEAQTADFRSDEYQKRIKQGFEVGRDASITIAKFNRTTIPRINAATDELGAVFRELREKNLASLNAATLSLHDAVDDVNLALTSKDGVLPEIAQLATKLGATADETNAAIKMAADKVGMSLDEMNRRLADPRIDKLMDQIVATGANVEATSAEIREAAKRAPTIAASLDKIASETSRFARITLIANVLSVAVPLGLRSVRGTPHSQLHRYERNATTINPAACVARWHIQRNTGHAVGAILGMAIRDGGPAILT